MLGAESRVKGTPLLATPPAVTTMFPVVAPAGTVTAMLVALQVPTVAGAPLNVTVPVAEPNPLPVIVTGVVATPFVVERPVMAGPG